MKLIKLTKINENFSKTNDHDWRRRQLNKIKRIIILKIILNRQKK
jgi:hypothetical protein